MDEKRTFAYFMAVSKGNDCMLSSPERRYVVKQAVTVITVSAKGLGVVPISAVARFQSKVTIDNNLDKLGVTYPAREHVDPIVV